MSIGNNHYYGSNEKDRVRMETLISEINDLSKRNSKMVVPLPGKRYVMEDFIEGFIAFRSSVRWK